MRETTVKPIPVACQHCGSKVAEIRRGMLVIGAKHHGKWHETVLSEADVTDLLRQMRAATEQSSIAA